MLILRGIAQGVPTAHLARELGIDRGHLLNRRHQVQQLLQQHFPPTPLADAVTEADELYQNAGEKGCKHPEPDDPPRRRANQFKGHGTWDHDRPPVAGVVGRASGQLRLAVCHQSDRATLEAFVVQQTRMSARVYTDEWLPYNHLPATGRPHANVHHRASPREWARDDDGDGVREVHCNTLEGIWTGVRNFLRPFRGLNKTELGHYLTVFELGLHCPPITPPILRAMMLPFTSNAT